MLKVVLFHSLIENVIALILRPDFRRSRSRRSCLRYRWLILNARVDNRYYLYSLPAEFLSERLRIRKPPGIKSENAIPAHIINIEVDHIKRQIPLPILAHHFFHHRLGVITPAALLIAQRPERRQRHVSGEVGVATQDLLHRRSVKKVVVQFATFGAKPGALLRRVAKVKVTAIAVIKKDSVSSGMLQAYVKRDGLIDRIFAFRVTRRVSVPVHKGIAPL